VKSLNNNWEGASFLSFNIIYNNFFICEASIDKREGLRNGQRRELMGRDVGITKERMEG
jgi:hypothetical protein